jgi:hypothetical protein
MIGAHIAHYTASGDVRSLRLAEGIALQVLRTFGDFTGQPPSFNAMCFQNFLMLQSATHDAALQREIVDRMHAYADWTWDVTTGARDPETNLFYFTDAGRPNVGHQPARLQDQGAMLQLHALVSWPPERYALLS